MTEPPVRYRPHHFLCSLGFEGRGYSDAFTANMAAIVMGRLRAAQGDDTVITVTATADSICAPCPRRDGSGCLDQGRIDALDTAHARALGIMDGQTLTWGQAKARIQARVMPGDLARICAGCSWHPAGMCDAALLRLHQT